MWNRKRLAIAVTMSLLIAVIAIGLSLGLGLGIGLRQKTRSATSTPFRHAAVAADAAVCSQVGVDILKKNGSAVDAAIASLFCVGVVNLHSTGIGGGGFMVYYNATSGKSTFIDYREVAPGAATVNMFNNASSLRGIADIWTYTRVYIFIIYATNKYTAYIIILLYNYNMYIYIYYIDLVTAEGGK